jgi:hypothetical protein
VRFSQRYAQDDEAFFEGEIFNSKQNAGPSTARLISLAIEGCVGRYAEDDEDQ